MAKHMTDEEMLALAQRRVASKKTFFHSLTVYIIVNAMLVAIWAASGCGEKWFLWVAFFWGIGIIFQAISVFAFPKEGGEWEHEALQKELTKIRKRMD